MISATHTLLRLLRNNQNSSVSFRFQHDELVVIYTCRDKTLIARSHLPSKAILNVISMLHHRSY